MEFSFGSNLRIKWRLFVDAPLRSEGKMMMRNLIVIFNCLLSRSTFRSFPKLKYGFTVSTICSREGKNIERFWGEVPIRNIYRTFCCARSTKTQRFYQTFYSIKDFINKHFMPLCLFRQTCLTAMIYFVKLLFNILLL